MRPLISLPCNQYNSVPLDGRRDVSIITLSNSCAKKTCWDFLNYRHAGLLQLLWFLFIELIYMIEFKYLYMTFIYHIYLIIYVYYIKQPLHSFEQNGSKPLQVFTGIETTTKAYIHTYELYGRGPIHGFHFRNSTCWVTIFWLAIESVTSSQQLLIIFVLAVIVTFSRNFVIY